MLTNSTSSDTWRIELFGTPLRALRNGKAVPHITNKRAALLLAFLALRPKQPWTREMLGEMLWPNRPIDRQLLSLRGTVTTLRSLFGQDFIVRFGNTALSINEAVVTDVAEFEEWAADGLRCPDPMARIGLLKQAALVYRDGLLPNQYLPHSDEPGGDWLERERERLNTLHLEAVRGLLHDLEKLGQTEEARSIRREAVRVHQEQTFSDVSLSRDAENADARAFAPAGRNKAFVGRENEISYLRRWLAATGGDAVSEENQILSVVGFGGVGKSRLIQEALEGFPFVFVPLTNVRTTDELYAAIQAALRASGGQSATLRRLVLNELRLRGSIVLALDGAEHLPRPVAEFWMSARASCPQLRLLITSHRPLRLFAEQTLRVKALEQTDALTLLLLRAEAVHPGFASTPTGKRAAGDIVRLLEGSPLAIEIAAARTLTLGPTQIREQLQRQLQFLVRAHPQENKRHQSLRAVLDWSISQLSPRATALLLRLGVFHGSFPLRAAEAIIGSDLPVVDAVEELCSHALLEVRFDPDDEEGIYYLQGVVAELAREKNQPQRREIARRHSRFYRQETERIASALQKEQWEEASRRLLRDLPNYRAAAATAHRGSETLRFLENLGLLYTEIGLWDDLTVLLKPVEARLHAMPPTAQLARIVGWCGALRRRKGENAKAWEFWNVRLQIMQSLDDTVGVVSTLFEMIGQAIDERNAVLAHDLLTRADEAISTNQLTRYALNRVTLAARLYLLRGETEPARKEAITGFALLRDTQRREPFSLPSRMYAGVYLIGILVDLCDDAEAETILREFLPLCHDQKRNFAVGVLLHAAGQMRLRQQRFEETAACFAVALSIHRDLESRYASLWAAEWADFRRNYGVRPEVDAIMVQADGLSYPEVFEKFQKIIL